MKKQHTTQEKITPDSFDLAVIEVVERLYKEGDLLPKEFGPAPNKKEILKKIGLVPEHWPQMVNHMRYVSRKPLKQADIVKKLKEHFLVNPDYINRYPSVKQMFLVPILNMVHDKQEEMPLTLHEMRKALIDCRSEREKLEDKNIELTAKVSELMEDLSNMRLLLSKLKKDQNPDKSPDLHTRIADIDEFFKQ